uniref:Uncharacterized protein n=1 Tax=Sphaerodactylus townsendi TaxID=933632 RepID=A0ACB8G6A4_9SAUR
MPVCLVHFLLWTPLPLNHNSSNPGFLDVNETQDVFTNRPHKAPFLLDGASVTYCKMSVSTQTGPLWGSPHSCWRFLHGYSLAPKIPALRCYKKPLGRRGTPPFSAIPLNLSSPPNVRETQQSQVSISDKIICEKSHFLRT